MGPSDVEGHRVGGGGRDGRAVGALPWSLPVARPRVTAYAFRHTTAPEGSGDVVAGTSLIAWRRIDEVPVGDPERCHRAGGRREPQVPGVVSTVAPAGGVNVDAGGWGVKSVRVMLFPPELEYVRTPDDFDTQYLADVEGLLAVTVTQVESWPPYVAEDVFTETPAMWAATFASRPFRAVATTLGENRWVYAVDAPGVLAGSEVHVTAVPEPLQTIVDDPLMKNDDVPVTIASLGGSCANVIVCVPPPDELDTRYVTLYVSPELLSILLSTDVIRFVPEDELVVEADEVVDEPDALRVGCVELDEQAPSASPAMLTIPNAPTTLRPAEDRMMLIVHFPPFSRKPTCRRDPSALFY